MGLFNICKEDFKKYKHELVLTACYTVALSVVYASWAYSELARAWISVLIILGFVLAGCVFYLVWVKVLKKRERTEGEK